MNPYLCEIRVAHGSCTVFLPDCLRRRNARPHLPKQRLPKGRVTDGVPKQLLNIVKRRQFALNRALETLDRARVSGARTQNGSMHCHHLVSCFGAFVGRVSTMSARMTHCAYHSLFRFGIRACCVHGSRNDGRRLCEEFIFRGYLTEQFSAWTGNRMFALILQGVIFGPATGTTARPWLSSWSRAASWDRSPIGARACVPEWWHTGCRIRSTA
jgi:hypothetical protein